MVESFDDMEKRYEAELTELHNEIAALRLKIELITKRPPVQSQSDMDSRSRELYKLCRADFEKYVSIAIHQDLRSQYLKDNSFEFRHYQTGWWAAHLRFIDQAPWADS